MTSVSLLIAARMMIPLSASGFFKRTGASKTSLASVRLPMVADMPHTAGVISLLKCMILLIASSVSTPRLEPINSCHSSTAITSRFSKSNPWSFVERRICRLSGVMMSISGRLLRCLCLSAVGVSPFLIPTCHDISRDTMASSIALPMSFASALSGVIQSRRILFFFRVCQLSG